MEYFCYWKISSLAGKHPEGSGEKNLRLFNQWMMFSRVLNWGGLEIARGFGWGAIGGIAAGLSMSATALK